MNLKIAIQPDETIQHNGERQSYSERWMELALDEEGVEAVPVDVFSEDVIDRIAACDAFMWRFSPSAHPRHYAKRFMYAVEKSLGVPVFPSLKSSWHFEDKIAQHYFLSAAGLPTPVTNIFWDRQQAEQFFETAGYPLVLKLSSGYQSSNVGLADNREEASYYVDQLFGSGVLSFGYRPAPKFRRFLRRLRMASEIIKGRHPNSPNDEADLHYGYIYAQEFLPGNEFDTRVMVIGNRAFALRRFNRPGDFRASGSGRGDWDPTSIDKDALRLALQVAQRLDAQTISLDILRRGSQPVIGELGLAYPSWFVRDCPGHWVLDGEPESGTLSWVEGRLRAEDAIFADFVAHLRQDVVGVVHSFAPTAADGPASRTTG